MEDGVIPGLENKTMVTDLAWCPFDKNELAVGLDNGLVHVWKVPDEGVLTSTDAPRLRLKGRSRRRRRGPGQNSEREYCI